MTKDEELLMGVERVEVQRLEIACDGPADEGDDNWWVAYEVSGWPNDREWEPVARADTFAGLLRLLGRGARGRGAGV